MSKGRQANAKVKSQLLAVGVIILFVGIAIIFDKGTKYLAKVMSPEHFAFLIFGLAILFLQVYLIPSIADKYFGLYGVESDSLIKRLIPFYNEYTLFESPIVGYGYIVTGLLTVLFGVLFWFVTPSMVRSIGLGNSASLNFNHTMLLLFMLFWLLASIFRGVGYVRVSADVDRANMEFSGCGDVTSTTRATSVVVRSGAVGTFMFILQMILFFVPLFRLFSLFRVESKLNKLRGINKFIVGEEAISSLAEDEEDDYEEEYENSHSTNRNRRRR